MVTSSKDKIIKLYTEGKSYNEIRKILGVSKSTISYHCRKESVVRNNKNPKFTSKFIEDLNKMYKEKTAKEVANHFNIKVQQVKYYCASKGRIERTSEEKRILNIQRVTERRRKNKEELITFKGSKCQVCGYSKYQGALEFHHINPNEKEFNLSERGTTRALHKLKKEVEKCALLCSNCHKEVHAGIIDLPEVLKIAV